MAALREEGSRMATTSVPPPKDELKGEGLQRGVLTLKDCLVLSAAVMAPALAVVLNAPAAGASAGKVLPPAYLQRNALEKLAAMGATMATDEIDFAEATDFRLFAGDVHRGVEPGHP